jgi:hypothetical protein
MIFVKRKSLIEHSAVHRQLIDDASAIVEEKLRHIAQPDA